MQIIIFRQTTDKMKYKVVTLESICRFLHKQQRGCKAIYLDEEKEMSYIHLDYIQIEDRSHI